MNSVTTVRVARNYYEIAECVSNARAPQQLAAFTAGGALDCAAKSAFLEAAIRRALRRPRPKLTERIGGIFDLGGGSMPDTSAHDESLSGNALVSDAFTRFDRLPPTIRLT